MPRCSPLLLVAVLAGSARADDAFDHYLNPTLAKAVGSEFVKEVKELTPAMLADNDRVLPNISAAFLLVKTNENRNAKLLVQPGRQKIFGTDKALSMILVERFVTYREGDERTVLASGKSLALFPNFRVNLDLGQVVPEELGGDLRYVVKDGKAALEPVGKARMFLFVKPMPDLVPKKAGKLVVGETFSPRYFNGTFKLFDDGRRAGTLTLKVDEEGFVDGSFYSDKDGQKYEVKGRLGMPNHGIQFVIKLPRTEIDYKGMLFTGDGKALAGTSRLQEREAAFYATRVEE